MSDRFVAQLAEDGRVHGLEEHLRKTAQRAGEFAAAFGCAEWGRVAALWHDLGKFTPEFQNYILNGGPRTDHSTAVALHAIHNLGKFGRVIAYLIAGHHAGLPDWLDDSEPGATLSHRLTRNELLARLESLNLPKDLFEIDVSSERPK